MSDEVVAGKKKIEQIPERRPSEEERKGQGGKEAVVKSGGESGLWRCKVCGYLSAMEHPPGKCPICGADRDRFEKFGFAGEQKVWRCKVCGYLRAMEHPPEKCPVCKADKDRFEEFIT